MCRPLCRDRWLCFSERIRLGGKMVPVPIPPLFLQALDVVDQVAYGFQVFGFAELDAAFVFQIADELNHVQGINTQGIEGGIFGNLLGFDVEVVVEKGGDGVHDIHDESPFVVR